ncbi:MAG: tetratricopeptide repeat protein [Promethearchaeota archaeon]
MIEKKGWKIETNIENYFRYSVKKNKIVLFNIKFPIVLPLRITIPFEVVNFKLSIAFQFWNLNQDIYVLILYLLKALRNLALSLTLDHRFQIEGKKQQLENLLNIVIPEVIKNENENTWLNRIRISLMNKKEKLVDFSDDELIKIQQSLEKFRLKPTFKIPWEVRHGVPRIRTTESLFFSNEQSLNEYFILEKGYFTYFNDIVFKKLYIRTLFDSYTPYILKEIFEDQPEFKLEMLIQKWIDFSREILELLKEIIEKTDMNQTEFIQFRPEKELIHNSPNFIEDQNNFPLSALSYESSITKELYTINYDLLNNPPSNFEVIETLHQYKQTKELIKNYRFEEAAQILNNALIIFNKNQQKKIIVKILLKLEKIAFLLNHEDTALNYLNNALSVAKSGEIPIEFIIKIHYKLGKIYYKQNDLTKALNHFDVIIKFLEKEGVSFYREKYLGLAYLYLGLIHHSQNNIEESKNYFKNSYLIGENDLQVKLKYFLLRGKYYKNLGKLSLAQKFLKAGVELGNKDEYDDKRIFKIKADLNLELSEFYIHYKKDGKKAFFLLENLEKHLPLKEISNMKRGVRCNLLLSDYYNIYGLNRDKSHFYLKQSQKLKNQLQNIGVN